MNSPQQTYTSATWKVKPGNEQEFIDTWKAFAKWTVDNVKGAEYARLLQDNLDATRFVSFAPWNNEETIANWREMDEFKTWISKLGALLSEPTKPGTYHLAASTEE